MSAGGVWEDLDSDPADREVERVRAWRLRCLLELGYGAELAELLAAARVDHHEVKALIARGCTLEDAARLMLP